MHTNRMIGVLDYGFARLIDWMGNDLSVIRAARVSYNAECRGIEDEKLINYLMENHHTSPFEAVTFTFEIMAPLFVLRQWHRHRTWSYNEVSARYTELPETYYLPTLESIGVQSKSSKQAREFCAPDDSAREWQEILDNHCHDSFVVYNDGLGKQIPRELARTALPLATYSRMFATVDLHNLFHFLRLRLHKHAQYEIRVYAEAMLNLITPIVPWCVAAFENFQPVVLSKVERQLIHNFLLDLPEEERKAFTKLQGKLLIN